jgi:hypothetical protein
LYQNNGGDVVVGVEEHNPAPAAWCLGDEYAADYRGMDLWGSVVTEKSGAGGIGPAPEKRETEQQDVAPVNQRAVR